jgi:hypothetical protein
LSLTPLLLEGTGRLVLPGGKTIDVTSRSIINAK